MVFKTTFGQSQGWSLIRGTLGVENEENNNLNFANEVFNRQDVLILGGRNSGISLYIALDVIQNDTKQQEVILQEDIYVFFSSLLN